MKFYEFNDYGYYALIGVDEKLEYPGDVAIKAYQEEVADIDEDEKDFTPNEITKEQALEQYKHAEIEGCSTEEEKVREFEKQIDLDNKLCVSVDDNKYVLLLIDGSLL